MNTQWMYPVAGVCIGGALGVVLNVYGVVPHAQGSIVGVILIVAGGAIGRAVAARKS